MKKQLLIFAFALCLSPYAFVQEYGWTNISANMPALGGFTDVHFIGDEGWITGGHNEVFYTSDGGNTFIVQNLPPQPANYGISSSVFMKNNMVGYVVTFGGNINKTIDGGTTWSTLHEPGGGFNSVHFPPNSDTGYTCGSNGTVWMFDETSITDISPSGVSTNLQSICFPASTSDGKVGGETTIARRKNNTWVNPQFYDSSLSYTSLFFIDNNKGWAVGTSGVIVRTTDGIYWTREISNTTRAFNDVIFINSLEGWAAGTEVLLHTIDGGVTWTEEAESLTSGIILRASFFTDANNGYVVGNDVVLKYGEVSGIGEKTPAFDFELFPNPVSDKFEVRSAEFGVNYGKVELYELSGKKVLEENIEKGNESIEIDVSQLERGMYLCKITIDNRSSTKKIVKE